MKASLSLQVAIWLLQVSRIFCRGLGNTSRVSSIEEITTVLMYIMLWALGPLGPITLLVQHTYTCTALYLYRTLMPPI